jgi:hypothetical protein
MMKNLLKIRHGNKTKNKENRQATIKTLTLLISDPTQVSVME